MALQSLSSPRGGTAHQTKACQVFCSSFSCVCPKDHQPQPRTPLPSLLSAGSPALNFLLSGEQPLPLPPPFSILTIPGPGMEISRKAVPQMRPVSKVSYLWALIGQSRSRLCPVESLPHRVTARMVRALMVLPCSATDHGQS